MSLANSIGNCQINPALARDACEVNESFLLGIVLHGLIANSDFATSLEGGTLFAVASIVDSVTRSMIAALFNADFYNTRLELLTRTIVVLTVVAPLGVVLAPMMGVTHAGGAAWVLVLHLILGVILGPRVGNHYRSIALIRF